MTTTPESHKAHSSNAASSIVLDMADTTWRMFVPTIGLLMVGRQLDTRFSTKPFLMVAGIVLGSLIAAYLVKAQIQRGGVTK